MSNENNETGEREETSEVESRQALIIALQSKGMAQAEIAEKLGVDQSTISRDLKQIKKLARKQIEAYSGKDVPFEFCRWISGLDEITKNLWDLVQDEKTGNRERMQALSMIARCYDRRIEMLVGGPDTGATAMQHIEYIVSQEKERW